MILPTTPKTIYKCTRLKIYTGHSSYYYYPHCSKGPHRINVSWMLWGLSSFLAHYWPLTKWKVLESGVVKNHSFLGAGVYVWSWITKIHTLAPSRILLYTLVLQCLANAIYKALTAWQRWQLYDLTTEKTSFQLTDHVHVSPIACNV